MISSSINIKRINLLFVFPIIANHGPAALAKAYIHSINLISKNKYLYKYFKFTIKSHVTLDYCRIYLNNSYSIVWFLFSNYFNELRSNIFNSIFKNIIYGPMVSPKKWFLFPMNNTFEVKWSFYINKIFAYVVQSERVKNHLINKSVKLKNIEKKYIVSQGCLFSNTTYYIPSWGERNIDVLLYVKFADINKENELQHLIKSIAMKYKFIVIRYGNHTRETLIQQASNSKILIYFSFYDCWPSSLMEMQNIGIYPLVQQCEFVEIYGTCIKDFNLNEDKILKTVDKLLSEKYNSKDISKAYRKRNNCLRVLYNTLVDIYSRKNKVKVYSQ